MKELYLLWTKLISKQSLHLYVYKQCFQGIYNWKVLCQLFQDEANPIRLREPNLI